MSFDADIDLALDVINNAFSSSERASFYDTNGVFEKDIEIIFDENSVVVDEEAQVQTLSENPEINVRKTLLGHDPIQDGRVDFRGSTYSIVEWMNDGRGMYSLQLCRNTY